MIEDRGRKCCFEKNVKKHVYWGLMVFPILY